MTGQGLASLRPHEKRGNETMIVVVEVLRVQTTFFTCLPPAGDRGEWGISRGCFHLIYFLGQCLQIRLYSPTWMSLTIGSARPCVFNASSIMCREQKCPQLYDWPAFFDRKLVVRSITFLKGTSTFSLGQEEIFGTKERIVCGGEIKWGPQFLGRFFILWPAVLGR